VLAPAVRRRPPEDGLARFRLVSRARGRRARAFRMSTGGRPHPRPPSGRRAPGRGKITHPRTRSPRWSSAETRWSRADRPGKISRIPMVRPTFFEKIKQRPHPRSRSHHGSTPGGRYPCGHEPDRSRCGPGIPRPFCPTARNTVSTPRTHRPDRVVGRKLRVWGANPRKISERERPGPSLARARPVGNLPAGIPDPGGRPVVRRVHGGPPVATSRAYVGSRRRFVWTLASHERAAGRSDHRNPPYSGTGRRSVRLLLVVSRPRIIMSRRSELLRAATARPATSGWSGSERVQLTGWH
jgi:hypothetical protein